MPSGNPGAGRTPSPATASLNARFPGQWFQSESGLHYNWHRQYDPSIGRYTQPDPLGFVDGPSVYGYAGGMPQMAVDPDGRAVAIPVQLGMRYCQQNPQVCAAMASGVKEAAKRAYRYCTSTTQEPRGDCGEDQHRDLQNRVENACGSATRCIGGDNASALNIKIGAHSQCIDARKRINNTCFRGGNPTHVQSVNERLGAIANCNSLLTQLGGAR